MKNEILLLLEERRGGYANLVFGCERSGGDGMLYR
jgi:hypothetical protein